MGDSSSFFKKNLENTSFHERIQNLVEPNVRMYPSRTALSSRKSRITLGPGNSPDSKEPLVALR